MQEGVVLPGVVPPVRGRQPRDSKAQALGVVLSELVILPRERRGLSGVWEGTMTRAVLQVVLGTVGRRKGTGLTARRKLRTA
jgi:hypothetical protein